MSFTQPSNIFQFDIDCQTIKLLACAHSKNPGALVADRAQRLRMAALDISDLMKMWSTQGFTDTEVIAIIMSSLSSYCFVFDGIYSRDVLEELHISLECAFEAQVKMLAKK